MNCNSNCCYFSLINCKVFHFNSFPIRGLKSSSKCVSFVRNIVQKLLIMVRSRISLMARNYFELWWRVFETIFRQFWWCNMTSDLICPQHGWIETTARLAILICAVKPSNPWRSFCHEARDLSTDQWLFSDLS